MSSPSPRHLQDNSILGASPASRPPSRATQRAFTNETYEATAAAASSTDQGNGTPISALFYRACVMVDSH